MAESTEVKSRGIAQYVPYALIVGAFAVLITVGILTS
jgi:hypothetical protein